jgi:hypothetical protein
MLGTRKLLDKQTFCILEIHNVKARMHGTVTADFTPVGALCMRKDLAHGAKLDGEVDRTAWVAHLGGSKARASRSVLISLFI